MDSTAGLPGVCSLPAPLSAAVYQHGQSSRTGSLKVRPMTSPARNCRLLAVQGLDHLLFLFGSQCQVPDR